MPIVSLKLGKPIEIENVDSSLTISGHGELIFSRGSVEWRPIGNSVNVHRFTWKQFADTMRTGEEFRLDGNGAAAKKAVAAKAPAKKAAAKAAAKKAPKKD